MRSAIAADLNNSKEGEQSTSTYGQQNMDEQGQMEEEDEDKEQEDEDELVVLEPEHEQDEEGEGKSKQIEVINDEPSRNITRNIKGQRREYYYLNTVKSNKELDKLRIKV
jgi:hypothetical protein